MPTNLTLNCEFRNGIHARPASFLSEFCQKLSSDVYIKNGKGTESYNAKSAISVVSSNILFDDVFTITLEGDHADKEIKNLKDYVSGEWLLCDENKESSVEETIDYLPKVFDEFSQEYISGKPVVKGIAKSKLDNLPEFSLNKEYLNSIEKLGIEEERKKFDNARNISISSLKNKLANANDDERDLVKFQIQFIGDEEFRVKVYSFIYTEYSAIEAINRVVDFYVSEFRKSESNYIKQRDIDVIDIGFNLMSQIDSEILNVFKPKIDEECILACNTLTPSQFISLDKRFIKGLIISNIGETSHTVILAKAYGIPTLINVDLTLLQEQVGSEVILDTYLGICTFDVCDRISKYYDSEEKTYHKIKRLNDSYIHGEVYTSDDKRVEVAANIINAEECEFAFKNGAEAVGLFRTEMMYIDSDVCPSKFDIASQIREVLSHTNGKPIIIRTLDIGGDKPAKYIHFDKEANPFLGYRGIRIYENNYDIFRDLIESILLEDKNNNIKIMVPMVSCLEEVIWFKENVDKIKNELNIDKKIELGIMIEVPSITYNIDACCNYVDFFSIGSNDLMQYFMAADRENKKVRHLYNKFNPSFIKLLNDIVTTVKKNNKWIGVCGELASDVDFLKLLIGMGVDELSMGCSVIPNVRRTIAHISEEKCSNLLADVLNMELSDDISSLVKSNSCEYASHNILSEYNIFTDMSFIDKDDAIKFLVDNLQIQGVTRSKYQLENDIWNREMTYSTDIGFGFAIPHAKSKNVDKTAISICKLASPVKWGEQDVNIIIMLTIKDDNSDDNQHMRIFSLLARKIMNSEFRNNLLSCRTSKDILELMNENLDVE